MKGVERLSFPFESVLDCSGQPLYCGIAAQCLRRSDPRGARSLAPPVVRKAALPFLGTPIPPTTPIASSSILQFKMATAAAAAAAAMAPPGCPGSCPNFAVVCSFLERYGPLLDLPELPFPELERVLQAPPPDVGSGEGKRGARTPGGKRPWHAAPQRSFPDTLGLRGSDLPRGRSSARPLFSAQPLGSRAVGRRGGGPLGPLGPAPNGGGGVVG